MNQTMMTMGMGIGIALGVMLVAGLVIVVLPILVQQGAHAKSFVSSYGDGYDAGKAAARAGNADVCDGSGTAYCTGFHVGWNAARLGQHLTAP